MVSDDPAPRGPSRGDIAGGRGWGGLPFRRRAHRHGPTDAGDRSDDDRDSGHSAAPADALGVHLHWPEHDLDHLVRPDELHADVAEPAMPDDDVEEALADPLVDPGVVESPARRDPADRRLSRTAVDADALTRRLDHLLTELRRTNAAAEVATRQLAARVDELTEAVANLRTPRETVDLSEMVADLREEVAALATSPRDALELRKMITALRQEVVALTAAPKEAGELRRTLAALRQDVAALAASPGEALDIGGIVGALRDEVARLSTLLAAVVDQDVQARPDAESPSWRRADDADKVVQMIRNELATVRDELVALRRRIPVKAKAPAALSAEDVEVLAEAVAARLDESAVRLAQEALPDDRRGRRWR